MIPRWQHDASKPGAAVPDREIRPRLPKPRRARPSGYVLQAIGAVTALADLERLGFITRIRRIRRIATPLGFTTRQITNAYRVHEPVSGIGLLATLVFATESNCWTASAHIVESLDGASVLNPESSPLHQALARLERLFKRDTFRLVRKRPAPPLSNRRAGTGHNPPGGRS
jgi:hypothetical protein